MRIAHVSATFPPYLGGAGTVCFHNARELARRGHEVHIFTAAMERAPTYEVLDGINVHRLRLFFRVGNMPILPDLASVLKGFDVIHLHYPFILGAELVRMGAFLTKTPLVVSFHNDLIGDRARAFIFKLYQNASARLTIQSASCLCVLSCDHFDTSRLHSQLHYSSGDNGLKIVELPNGVDLNQFNPFVVKDGIRRRYGIANTTKLALFVAALDRAHHFKGLGYLLQAIQNLPSNYWLLVVGKGDLREEYERQASELGIASRVVFAGGIQHEKLPAYFRSADVTVLPSSQTESFGLVLVESLACGTPVIATRLPGVRTVVDEGRDGLLVETGSPPSLASAIWRILDDNTLRAEMGSRGRAKVEARYGWEQIGKHLESIYQQVLNEAEN